MIISENKKRRFLEYKMNHISEFSDRIVEVFSQMMKIYIFFYLLKMVTIKVLFDRANEINSEKSK